MRYAVACCALAACASETPASPSGAVTLTTWDQGGSVFARFYEAADPLTSVSTIGPCEISKLQAVSDARLVYAGAITVTGARSDITLATAAEGGDYTQFNTMTTLFDGGETLMVSASGGQVPPFNHRLTAPGKTTVTAPVPPSTGNDLEIPLAQDFAVSWTGGSGLVEVLLYNFDDMVACRFPASDGTGIVPQAALAPFARVGSGQLEIATVDHAEIHAGDWLVRLHASWGLGIFAYVTFD